MFSKEQLQRFSIRKLTVGTASVLIGVLFLTSWNTNNVYADSRNVTSGESIAKNNNPQEGNPAVNKDNVQIIDNNSTEVSNISDSKSSKVIKSDATKSDIVRDKTTIDDNSRTKVPELTAQANNKQALTTVTEDNGAKVSKTEKYSNSDIKNQSRNSEKTQETTLVKKVLDKEKLSSESLIDQKKLDGKVEIPATDPSNTITATDPSNYPKLNGLIGEDKYIYQVLSLEPEYWYSRSKLILSVNRNDPNDKNIYAYVIDGNYNYNDGNYNYNSVEKSITIGMDKSSIITIDGREYRLNNNGSSEVSINGKTVSTQNSSTVTSKPRYLDNLPISQDYGLGNTSNGNCSAIGEIVPVFTKNSVIKYYYRDNEGNLTEIENSPNVTVNGFTGQEFEINDVGQYKKLILGYYLTSAPTGNFKGTLSQFSGDKYYKKVYYDFDTGTVEYSVLYHQISPDGTMEVGLFDANGYPLTERRVIAPNSSTEFSKYNLTVRNPYVTAAPHEVQFIYKKLGSIIPVDENENPIGDAIQFENNSKDPTKALPGKVPSISGYTPSYELVGDKKVPIKVPISVGDKVVPTDPGENIKVVYTANAQTATITYIDDDTTENKTLGSDKQNGKFNQVITFEHDPAEVIKGLEEKGYKLVSNNFDNQKYNADNSKNQFEVHFSHQTQNVKRNDTVSQTIHYVYDDGTKAEDDNAQTLSFEQHGVQDMVTHDIIWTPSDSQSFTAVTTPTITGYTPDVDQVDGHSVNFGDSDQVITVTYSANAQQAGIKFIDDTDSKTLDHENANGKFDDEIKFNRDVNDEISQFEGQGYKLVSTNFNNNKYQSDNANNQFEVHFIHGTKDVSRDHNVIQTIHYVLADGTKVFDNNVQTLKFTQPGVQDLVTGKIEWTSIPSQTFTQVASPFKDGYTPDQKVILANTANFDSNDSEIIVTYTTNDQAAGIKYIDDTTGKTLDTHQASGKFGDVIKFSRDVNDEISQFESQNYKLVSNNFDNQKYVSDNTKNQFEVHFVHVTKNVTRTDKVNRTIHYVYSDGKTAEPDKVQVVNFTEDGVQDLVTGNITWTSAKSQKMVSVDTPKLEGYTPDIKSVASQTVNFDDKDLDTTVTYSADAQQLDVAFIDDTTGKTLQTVVKNGHSDEQSGYNTKNDINNYLGEHYKLVSDSTNGNDLVFDHDDKADQHYEVHFVHVTKNVTRTDKVNRTIHYVYSDGKTAEPDKVQVVNFTEDGVQDLVTGNITWTSAKSQKMVSVDTPKLEGYTPDIKSVASQTVNFGDKDLDTTVTYSADAQTATITYIDDTTENKTLGSDKQNGKFNQVITFEHDPAEVIKGLEEKGYKLVSNDFNSNKYQADNSNNVFYVHLKHGTSESSRKDDVNMTVHYVMDDGSKAPSDSKQTVSFTENGIKDNVTGNITWTPATSQTLKDVDSPVLTGYTADIKTANGKAVNFGDPDINVTVHYSANAQTAKITYIDDTTKTNLDSKEANGKFGQAITFEHDPAEVIKGLEEKGYVLVSNSFNKQTYDANNSNNVFYVHLKHGTKNVSRDHNVNMTVHYVMDDGSKAPSDSKQTVSFTESGIQDLVTQKITWTPADSQKFDDVVTPAITGYTPDQDKVAGQTANFDTQDRKVTVTYSPDIQLGRINYIDDNTGKTLTHDDFSGRTNEHEDYTPIDRIQEFENKGYELVSNDYPDGGFNFDDNDQQDQVFNVHLKHGTTTVTPDNPGRPGEPVDPDNPDGPKYRAGTDKTGLTDTVNRTITYVMSDGSKAPEAVHDSLSYTASKVIDKVTLEVLETKWSANQDFKDVDSPSVKGYTPDKKTVSNKNVAHDAADITETVKYSADAQKASVTYIDDKTGKTLKVDNLNGVTNAKSGYTTKAAIDTYTGLGYTLVSDDTNGNEVVFDNDDANDQAFTVHLSHGTITVTPKNPGKPGEPVDPDNPDGPKYPDGTDEYQVKRTGTQTIHYVGASDKTPADNNQTFIFTREITFDNVTGNIISVTPWNVQSHTFGNVDTPVIPGYHADKAVAGGATVTPDDLNRVITVTYAPDGNPGNPGDQGDTPTPEPTPEPDPTPNPTPDDQPDSEISSDEHFENVKAKDKLDKTNPKKMDAYKKERKIIKTKIAKQDHTEIAEPKLPQTGEADNSIIGLLGMLLASFAAMFGFDSLHSHDKKHKN